MNLFVVVNAGMPPVEGVGEQQAGPPSDQGASRRVRVVQGTSKPDRRTTWEAVSSASMTWPGWKRKVARCRLVETWKKQMRTRFFLCNSSEKCVLTSGGYA